jgi:hypothetical protein
MSGNCYHLTDAEAQAVIARTNAEIAATKNITPREGERIATRVSMDVIKERRPPPTKSMHGRLVMMTGRIGLSSVFSPLEREILLTLLEAVEPLYRPTPKKESEENSIRASEIEQLSENVAATAAKYILACDAEVDPDEKYPAIDLWKSRLRMAVSEYRDAIEEQYG